MAGSKEIRNKIKSVQSTRKITKAMEMVAASKMKKAQDRMRASRPYVERVFDIAVLIDALRRLGDGESVVDPTIVARLLGRRRQGSALDELTTREREVLALLAEGLSNHAIAERLVVTDRTIEAHVKQIFQKLDLAASPDSNRRVLAVLAYLRG